MEFHYSDGTTNFGELDINDIVNRVKANPSAKHLVWKEGMSGWTDALLVPEIKNVVDRIESKDVTTGMQPIQPPAYQSVEGNQAGLMYSSETEGYRSGQGKSSLVPEEIKKWN